MIRRDGVKTITEKVSGMGFLGVDVQVCSICALHCSLLLGIRPEFCIPVFLEDAFHGVGNGVEGQEGELEHRHRPRVVLGPHQCLGEMIVLSLREGLGSASECQLGMV